MNNSEYKEDRHILFLCISGMHFKNTTLMNMFLYNGKELQEQTNYIDYGFRQRDPQLGRWHVIDAMAENYFSTSPYAYVRNNPISRFDVMGLWDDYEDDWYVRDEDGDGRPDEGAKWDEDPRFQGPRDGYIWLQDYEGDIKDFDTEMDEIIVRPDEYEDEDFKYDNESGKRTPDEYNNSLDNKDENNRPPNRNRKKNSRPKQKRLKIHLSEGKQYPIEVRPKGYSNYNNIVKIVEFMHGTGNQDEREDYDFQYFQEDIYDCSLPYDNDKWIYITDPRRKNLKRNLYKNVYLFLNNFKIK